MNHTVLPDGSHETHYQYVPAVYCSERFADFIDKNPENEASQKMANSKWVCPDTKEIKILNNALYEPDLNANNFVMVVNDCKVSQESTKDEDQGDLTPYAKDKDCLADDD